MAQQGCDISRQRSKHVSELMGETFDYVITRADGGDKLVTARTALVSIDSNGRPGLAALRRGVLEAVRERVLWRRPGWFQ